MNMKYFSRVSRKITPPQRVGAFRTTFERGLMELKVDK